MVYEQLDRTHGSGQSRAYDEHNIATDMVLHLGYEIEAQEVAVQKEHEAQNVELISICDGPSGTTGDASRNRKIKKIIKEASIDLDFQNKEDVKEQLLDIKAEC